MTLTDPIADMLTRIRNATTASHDTVDIPSSVQKQAIVKLLKQEGYIEDWALVPAEKGQAIKVTLKYSLERAKTIHGIKRVSSPGLRVYAKSTSLPKVLGGMGIAIVSTSSGLMTGNQAARQHLGGEVIAYVW